MRIKVSTYLGPLIVTGLAVAVAIMITAGRFRGNASEEGEKPDRAIPQTAVSVMRVPLESIEITDAYSGMIRPRERFSLGFEIAGRVAELGVNQGPRRQGKSLDEGDRVGAGDVLARLDDRVLRARLEEAKAQLDRAKAQNVEYNALLEKAQSDMGRAEELKRRGGRVITAADYQDTVSKLAVAEAQTSAGRAQLAVALAQLQTANKNLEDSTLLSPVSGVISKRYVNAGESVNPQQIVMEIIQVDEVLLVIGVPEAYVGAIRAGQQVHVELLARDRFGRKRPTTQGSVFQVAEAADQTTGLFDVEIVLSNPRRDWKPGLIALARIVVDEVQGFRIPMSCAVFRKDQTYLFLLDEVAKDGKAHRLGLRDWIEEGSDLVVPLGSAALGNGGKFLFSPGEDGHARRFDVPPDWNTPDWGTPVGAAIPPELPEVYWTIVSRGQHRLVDGRPVKRVELRTEQPAQIDSQPRVRPAEEVVGSRR